LQKQITPTVKQDEGYTCKYCKKTYKRESTLMKHMCEPKRRFQQKEEAGPRLGMQAYLKFYKLMHQSTKIRTFEDFSTSAYYSAFVKFGNYCVAINAVNPDRFADWVIKNNKKIDHWCRDAIYNEYLLEYLQKENPMDALKRTLEQSYKWAKEYDADSKDMLRHGNIFKMCHLITSGKISPWVLYTCESGQQLLGSLNEDQITFVWDFINPEIWQEKIKIYEEESNMLTDLLKEAKW